MTVSSLHLRELIEHVAKFEAVKFSDDMKVSVGIYVGVDGVNML